MYFPSITKIGKKSSAWIKKLLWIFHGHFLQQVLVGTHSMPSSEPRPNPPSTFFLFPLEMVYNYSTIAAVFVFQPLLNAIVIVPVAVVRNTNNPFAVFCTGLVNVQYRLRNFLRIDIAGIMTSEWLYTLGNIAEH